MFGKENRLAWLFLILSALALASVITALALRGRAAQSESRIPEVSAGQSAKQAFAQAKIWAEEWHPEAVLINCTVSQFKATHTHSGWTFQIYDAGSQSLAAVRVSGQEVTVLKETPALWTPVMLPIDAWQLDSPEVLGIWWDQGGQAVWSDTDVEAVHLRLGLSSAGSPVWQITTTRRSAASMDFWEISAETGAVLEHIIGGDQ